MINILHIISRLSLFNTSTSMIAYSKYSSMAGDCNHRVISLKHAAPEAIKLAEKAGLTVIDMPDRHEILEEIGTSDIVQIDWWNTPEMDDLLRTELPEMRLLMWYHVPGDIAPQMIPDWMINFSEMTIFSFNSSFDLPPVKNLSAEKKENEIFLAKHIIDYERYGGKSLKKHRGFNIGYIGQASLPEIKHCFCETIPDSNLIVCSDEADCFLKGHADHIPVKVDFYNEYSEHIIQTFDVFTCSTIDGQMSDLMLKEIMSLGITPVVFPCENDILLHNYNCLIVHNEVEYKEAIEYLYNNPHELVRLGKNAADYGKQNFKAEKEVKKLELIYKKIMGCNRKKYLLKEIYNDEQSKGSRRFIEFLGDKAIDFQTSINSKDSQKILKSEANIASSSSAVYSPDYGGVLDYRHYYPCDGMLRLWAGLILQKLGKLNDATVEFAEALKYGCNHWRTGWYLAQTLEKSTEKNEIYSLFSQAIPEFPVFKSLIDIVDLLEHEEKEYKNFGNIMSEIKSLRIKGHIEEASSMLEKLVSYHQESSELCNLQGELYFQLGEKEKAENIFKKIVRKWPDYSIALNNLGVISGEDGDYYKALEYFKESFKIDRHNKMTVLNLGDILVKLQEYDEAKKIYLTYLQYHDDDGEIKKILQKLESEYDKIIYKDSKFKSSLKNLYDLAKDRPLCTNELHISNDFYGHAAILKQYAGVPSNYQIKGSIEHGIHVKGWTWDVDMNAPLPAVFTLSPYRLNTLKKKTGKALFSIGPVLHYAPDFLDESAVASEKERLGKNLLFFPVHSTHHVDAHYDINKCCQKLEELRKNFDTIRICLYWKDILRGHADMYVKYGFECVTAGHMYDPMFLSRLKSLIRVADSAASNQFGTHIGYSILMNKPFYLFEQSVEHTAKTKEILKRDRPPEDEGLKVFFQKFSSITDDITDEQRDIIEEYWGLSECKTAEEMRLIFDITEDMYRKGTAMFMSGMDVLSEQCIDFVNSNRNREALFLFEQDIKVNPDIVELNYGKSIVLARMGQSLEAINILKNLINIKPSHRKAKLLLDELTGKPI